MRIARRRLRLQRYKKIRRQVHHRFSQRIFEHDRNIIVSYHPLLLLTSTDSSSESGIWAFRAL